MRSVARERLFQLIFEYQFHRETNALTLKAVGRQDNIDASDFEYIEICYLGITQQFDGLAEEFSELSQGFSIRRMFKTDVAILALAAYEIMYRPEIPASVSCNEAVELAKKYSTEKSPAYVNGILASLVRKYEKK